MSFVPNLFGFMYSSPQSRARSSAETFTDSLQSCIVNSAASKDVVASFAANCASSSNNVVDISLMAMDCGNEHCKGGDEIDNDSEQSALPIVHLVTDAYHPEDFDQLEMSNTSRKRKLHASSVFRPIVDVSSIIKPTGENASDQADNVLVLKRAKVMNDLLDSAIAPVTSDMFLPDIDIDSTNCDDDNSYDMKKLKMCTYAYVACLRQFVTASLQNERTLATQTREFYRCIARVASGQIDDIVILEELCRFVILFDYEQKVISAGTVVLKNPAIQQADSYPVQFILDDICINRVLTDRERKKLAAEKNVQVLSTSSSSSSQQSITCPLSLEEALKYFAKNIMRCCFPHIDYNTKRNLTRPVSRAVNSAIEIMLANFTLEALLLKEADFNAAVASGGGKVATVCSILESAYDSGTLGTLSQLAAHVELAKRDENRIALKSSLKKIKKGKDVPKEDCLQDYVLRVLQAKQPEHPLVKETVAIMLEKKADCDDTNINNSSTSFESPRRSPRIANSVTPATSPSPTKKATSNTLHRKTTPAKKKITATSSKSDTTAAAATGGNQGPRNQDPPEHVVRKLNRNSAVKFAVSNVYSSAEYDPVVGASFIRRDYQFGISTSLSDVLSPRSIRFKQVSVSGSQGGEIVVTTNPFITSFPMKEVPTTLRIAYPATTAFRSEDDQLTLPTGSYYDLPMTPWREILSSKNYHPSIQSLSNSFIREVAHATQTFASESNALRNGAGDEQLMFMHSLRDYLVCQVNDLDHAVNFRLKCITEKRKDYGVDHVCSNGNTGEDLAALPVVVESKYSRIYKHMCVFSRRQLVEELYRSLWSKSNKHLFADCFQQMSKTERVPIPYIPKLECRIDRLFLERFSPVFDCTFTSLKMMFAASGQQNSSSSTFRRLDEDIFLCYLPSIEQHGNDNHPAVVSEPHCYFYHHDKAAREENDDILRNEVTMEDMRQPLTVYVALTPMEAFVYDYFSLETLADDGEELQDEAEVAYDIHSLSQGDVLVIKGHQPHSIGRSSEKQEVAYLIGHFCTNDWRDLNRSTNRRRPFWFGEVIATSEEFAADHGPRADEFYRNNNNSNTNLDSDSVSQV